MTFWDNFPLLKNRKRGNCSRTLHCIEVCFDTYLTLFVNSWELRFLLETCHILKKLAIFGGGIVTSLFLTCVSILDDFLINYSQFYKMCIF